MGIVFLAVPADPDLVLHQLALQRSFVLIEIDGVEVHAVDLSDGVQRVGAAGAEQESMGQGHPIRRYEELLLHPFRERRGTWMTGSGR